MEIQINNNAQTNLGDMINWCCQHFGIYTWDVDLVDDGANRWGFETINGATIFHFACKDDAEFFAMEWTK